MVFQYVLEMRFHMILHREALRFRRASCAAGSGCAAELGTKRRKRKDEVLVRPDAGEFPYAGHRRELDRDSPRRRYDAPAPVQVRGSDDVGN